MALDLDARFAGVDVRLAEIREVLALHTTRFTKLETRLSAIEGKLDAKLSVIDGKLDQVLPPLLASPDRTIRKSRIVGARCTCLEVRPIAGIARDCGGIVLERSETCSDNRWPF
jgi:hypothetical protein